LPIEEATRLRRRLAGCLLEDSGVCACVCVCVHVCMCVFWYLWFSNKFELQFC